MGSPCLEKEYLMDNEKTDKAFDQAILLLDDGKTKKEVIEILVKSGWDRDRAFYITVTANCLLYSERTTIIIKGRAIRSKY